MAPPAFAGRFPLYSRRHSERGYYWGMAQKYVETSANHYRLTPETWALIAEEYCNGATAKDVGAKWKVARSTIYRHSREGGWTKKSMGDTWARAHAKTVEVEARARRPVGPAALNGLFSPAMTDDPDAGDPAALAKLATLASGRAMTGRLWAEARALAGLAESYTRLSERAGRFGGGWGQEPSEADFEAVRRKVLGEDWQTQLEDEAQARQENDEV